MPGDDAYEAKRTTWNGLGGMTLGGGQTLGGGMGCLVRRAGLSCGNLIGAEVVTASLVGWLNARASRPLVTSTLAEVEVARAIRRVAPDVVAAVPNTLARLYRVEIDAGIRHAAAAPTAPDLRTLDAPHIATALVFDGEVESFISYDRRLLVSAAALGLPVASPGDDGT